MNRYALTFTVRPGTEPAVADILRGYRRPPPGAAGGPALLRRTSVFMAATRVVRVIDVDGDIGAVLRHLGDQPQIRAVEEALDPYLSTPRDLRSAEGVRAFLHHALLPIIRPAGAGEPEPAAADLAAERCGLLLPVRDGGGDQAAQAFAALTSPVSTTAFRRGDVLVGLLEASDGIDDTIDQLALSGSRTAAAALLAGAVHTTADLQTAGGLRSFLAECRMELLTDRQVGVPA